MKAEPALERVIESCLPFDAKVGAVRVARGSVPPEDQAQFPTAWSEKRAREHWAGRRAAASVLRRYGLPETVGRADDGVPLFPRGVAGSIAHTGGRSVLGLCIASQAVPSLGIDIEDRKALSPELIERIVDDKELAFLGGIREELGDTGLWAFCAKEAYYKCVFPSHRRFLGFHEVLFTCDPHMRTPSEADGLSSLLVECLLGEKALGDSLSGRIVLTDEFVVSVVWAS